MRKLALALIATAGFLAAASSAAAQESRTAARLIADDVMLGSIAVGGMSADQARAAVLATFDVPLRFTFKKRTWKATPSQLGASPRSEAALARALAAAPGAQIPLLTKIESKKLRRYAVYLDRVFTRAARDTRVRIVNSRPKYSKPRPGVRVDRDALTKSLLAALNEHDREPIALSATLIEPAVTPDTFGPVVVIQRGTKRLALYKGRKLVRKFGVATGLAQYPTPIGSFKIVTKLRNPTWNPPNSDWARGASPIPPGPGNPLGTRWMGISSPAIGIHGTPDAASIGYSRSHGCVRMHVSEAEWLFENVDIGTPIFITQQEGPF